MTRHLISVNTQVFTALDDFCRSRAHGLSNSGARRWIASESKHRYFMTNSKVVEQFSFSPTKKLAKIDIDARSYLLSIGFDVVNKNYSERELELDPAFLTVALAELRPRPKADVSHVKNIVEWSDKDADSNYRGHSYEEIATIYPAVRVFDFRDADVSSVWNVFFEFCLDECSAGFFWMDRALAETLSALCKLDSRRIPYKVLCRSIFDSERSTFFLAQYRCLEALYAYSSAQSLVTKLAIPNGWGEVATILEDALGWHPREERSLEAILRYASPLDLVSILSILNKDLTSDPDLLVSRASKSIYWLRNSFVHYRPAQHQIDSNNFDWDSLCVAMTGIILDVYSAVFP